jgi:hypothetical protein
MYKLIIYGVNINNLLKFDVIISDLQEYFDFKNIKNIIEQYDFIILLDNTKKYNYKKISKLLNFLIDNDYDQLILDNSQKLSLEIMEYNYYYKIIKSNRIFKNLKIQDLKQKNISNNYKPFQYILGPSIIRTKNFILPNFFLKKNSHIENLYWRELLRNNFRMFIDPYLHFKIESDKYYITSKNTKIDEIESERCSIIYIDIRTSNIELQNKQYTSISPLLTIITGYLNIKIKRPAKSNTVNQTYDYIDKSRATLQIPQYMVIYCSEDIIENVTKIREDAGLLHITKIIKITIDNNLYMLDKLDIIYENVAKNNPPYDIPEYILAVNSRYGYIQNAIENNYFNTDYFAWVDFSASHIVDIPSNKIIEPKINDKIRIGWIARYSNNQFVYNHHCLGGGIFTGHKEIMMELIKIHHLEFLKLTEMGYNINDDKLLFIIKEQYPYLFDTYFSDYKSLFNKL